MSASRLRRDLPFRRIAVVLSGGGALGAYQAGVLRALQAAGVRPGIVAGLSVGAINGAAWVANDFDPRPLERAWRRAGPSTVGMRWTTLTVRVFGLFLAALATFEVVLTLIGTDELVFARLFLRRAAERATLPQPMFETIAWVMVGLVGFLLSRLARRVDDWISRRGAATRPDLWHLWFGRGLLALAVVHVATWWLGWPWPHRFSATALVLGFAVWLPNLPGPTGDRVRQALIRGLPESGGRGLWRGIARRRLMERLAEAGDPARLVDGRVHLLVNAVELTTGRMCWFVNAWPPSRALADAAELALADLVHVRTPSEVVQATVASSAVPLLFQPVRLAGHEYVDAGMFSSRALHLVIADGADAVLVVLMSPLEWPLGARRQTHLLEVGARLLELGNWRDLRGELGDLPAGWSRRGDPARICVVEPEGELPSTFLGFDRTHAAELIVRGERDAWAALAGAGWLAEGGAGATPAS